MSFLGRCYNVPYLAWVTDTVAPLDRDLLTAIFAVMNDIESSVPSKDANFAFKPVTAMAGCF